MRELSEAAKAYVGAMIDAEGVVTIACRRFRYPSGNAATIYAPVLIVTNAHAGLIGFLNRLTGTGIVYTNRKPPRPNWSPMHRWQVVAAAAQRLLAVILPYLVIKRSVGELVLQFQPMPKTTPHAEREQLRSVQAAIYERVKFLNARGAGCHKSTMTADDFPADHPLL